ncbi:MAG: beta-galactosidase trimerization domain-containing protein, partial [Planctomycetota bacterium]
GTWVTTFWSGIVDETVLVHEQGFTGPLRDLLGIRSEEMDVLYPDERCPIQPQPGVSWIRGEHAARDFCDLIHVDDADVLATYAGEFYEGRPALTVARRGKGRAYYLAFRAQQPWLDQMYAQLLEEQGVQPLIDHLPEGVTAQVRGDENSTFLFLLNFTRDEHRIDLPPGVWRNLLTDEEATGGIALTGYDSAALSPHAKFLNP